MVQPSEQNKVHSLYRYVYDALEGGYLCAQCFQINKTLQLYNVVINSLVFYVILKQKHDTYIFLTIDGALSVVVKTSFERFKFMASRH